MKTDTIQLRANQDFTPCLKFRPGAVYHAEPRRRRIDFGLWTLDLGRYPNPDQLRLNSTEYGLKNKNHQTNPFHAADAYTRTFQPTNSPMPSATSPPVPTIVPSRAQSCPKIWISVFAECFSHPLCDSFLCRSFPCLHWSVDSQPGKSFALKIFHSPCCFPYPDFYSAWV